MSNVQDTEYITIKSDGIFVGREQTRRYHGGYIRAVTRSFYAVLAGLKQQHPNVVEIQCIASNTQGDLNKFGNPSPEFGPNAWFRVKMCDGTVLPWCYSGYASVSRPGEPFAEQYWADLCADTCMNNVDADHGDFYNLLKKLDGNPKLIKIKMLQFKMHNWHNRLFLRNSQRVK